MTRLLALALVAQLGACEEAPDPFPIGPGGGTGTGTGTQPDAAIDARDAGGPISGRVCVQTSQLHTLTQCPGAGAGGLTVTLGDAIATTADDGTFMLKPPAETTGLAWRVTGADIVTSIVDLDATTLPAFDAAAYAAMLASNQVQGTAGLIVRITRLGAPVANATVATTPAPDSEPLYDAESDDAWATDMTRGAGVAWIPSVPGTSAQLAITENEKATVIDGIPLENGALTFVFAEIP